MTTTPVQGFRVGAVRVAIWENQSPNGTRFNATFQRLYHDQGLWKTSTSFGRNDLSSLVQAAEMARDWIAQKERYNNNGG